MARFSLQLPLTFLLFLLFTFILATQVSTADVVDIGTANYQTDGGEGSVKKEDCPKECERRCSATSHQKPCLFFCNMCCEKCLCVPSGTSGHKEECPCYNNWKTKEGKPKCP